MEKETPASRSLPSLSPPQSLFFGFVSEANIAAPVCMNFTFKIGAGPIGGVFHQPAPNLAGVKSGRTSAPRLPQALQVNRGSMGTPEVVGPFAGAHLDRTAAFVVSAIDQDPVDAGGAHLAEADLRLQG